MLKSTKENKENSKLEENKIGNSPFIPDKIAKESILSMSASSSQNRVSNYMYRTDIRISSKKQNNKIQLNSTFQKKTQKPIENIKKERKIIKDVKQVLEQKRQSRLKKALSPQPITDPLEKYADMI